MTDPSPLGSPTGPPAPAAPADSRLDTIDRLLKAIVADRRRATQVERLAVAVQEQVRHLRRGAVEAADALRAAVPPLSQNEQAWEDLRADGGLPESQTCSPVMLPPHSIHRCLVCGALWRRWADDGTWSVIDADTMGACCNNVAMGDQIEQLYPPRSLGALETLIASELYRRVRLMLLGDPPALTIEIDPRKQPLLFEMREVLCQLEAVLRPVASQAKEE